MNKLGFQLSALCFFLIQAWPTPISLIGALIGFVITIKWYKQISSIETSRNARLFALLTSIGTVATYRNSILMQLANSLNNRLLQIGCIVLCIGAIYFLYIILSAFYEKFAVIFKEIVSDITKKELYIYGALFLIVSTIVTVVYCKTSAFYSGTDVIYTGDSGLLMEQSSFTNIFSLENDFRQPLFAVFSIPFVGLFANSAITLQIAQIGLLIFSVFTLAKCMQAENRIGFVLFFSENKNR